MSESATNTLLRSSEVLFDRGTNFGKGTLLLSGSMKRFGIDVTLSTGRVEGRSGGNTGSEDEWRIGFCLCAGVGAWIDDRKLFGGEDGRGSRDAELDEGWEELPSEPSGGIRGEGGPKEREGFAKDEE